MFVNESNKDLPIGACVEHCSVSIGGTANAGDTGTTIPSCRHGVNDDSGGGTNTTDSSPICMSANPNRHGTILNDG